MSINFNQSIISRLKREIAQLEAQSLEEQKKKAKAEAKLKQLQRDSKRSILPSDLSSKLTRMNKLNAEVSEISKRQADLAKQLDNKKAELKKHPSK